MTADGRHVRLRGSAPVAPAGAVEHAAGRPADDAPIELDVLVASRQSPDALLADVRGMADQLPARRRYLDHAAFEREYGADPQKLARLEAFAREAGLEVRSADPGTRLVVLRGTADAVRRAFRVEFTAYRHEGRTHASFRGDLHVPVELRDVVEAVFGLDTVPRFDRRASGMDAPAAGAAPEALPTTAADPRAVERIYQFPEPATGKGQRVGIILLGGGFFPDDLDAYFQASGLRRPDVRVVEVGGAKNDPVERGLVRAYLEDMGLAPRDPSTPRVDWQTLPDVARVIKRIWWTIEAALDIQLVGTFANGADLVVYFAQADERGKVNALATALGDREHDLSVVTCSWGAPEDGVHGALIDSVDRLLQTAALKGITVCYSSGDRGADADAQGVPHVQFPASSPHVLSCGGTTLNTIAREAETAWHETMLRQAMATGGGFSRWFASPPWQASAVAGFGGQASGRRGVPDVAGKADMAHGYPIVVAGHRIAMGGTSAAAPMWAGLIARLNESLGHRVGWITPLLYGERFRGVLRDVRLGGDGLYDARPGWDPCTGCGTPLGRALLEALTSVP